MYLLIFSIIILSSYASLFLFDPHLMPPFLFLAVSQQAKTPMVDPIREKTLRERLQHFYRERNPENAGNIDSILVRESPEMLTFFLHRFLI